MKNITSLEAAATTRAKYRSTCEYRRNGATIEIRIPDGWTVTQGFKSINAAKRACRGGKYSGQPIYRV